ncbi:hypothetical protein CRI93_03835 [Longimonas halophila]|uniref:Glycosyltransferase 2-like domain-containing protein n=1 Tax=Longimonas halophila TaxID=1469170 RepID=A0A2H3NW27_9BACT|nr:glycosyltransferase [Longimonas halophila]PEN08887.1 hypothetical protein CRI93_03835 [Longimonas halophila]
MLDIHALVLATRNRPADVARTLRSVACAEGAEALHIVLVDGSDPNEARATQRVVDDVPELHVDYHTFPGDPAASRQRNYGVAVLPPSMRVVHFLDDDVKVHPQYFVHLADALRQHPKAGGVAGRVCEPERPPPPDMSWIRRFFLLDGDTPGTVLSSGRTTPLHRAGRVAPVQWMPGGACAYRRAVFNTHRFDAEAEGPSPRIEDLDFSYRVGQSWPLLVQPKARLNHYPSSVNRARADTYATERLAWRAWFVQKNLPGPVHTAAFWWATLGEALAMAASSHPDKWRHLRGHLRGIQHVCARSHPLLRTIGS